MLDFQLRKLAPTSPLNSSWFPEMLKTTDGHEAGDNNFGGKKKKVKCFQADVSLVCR